MGLNPEKSSELYRAQLSTSLDEKQESLERLALSNLLPQIDGKKRLLELGTGGGETFALLKQKLSSFSDIEYLGIDAVQEFAEHSSKNGIESIVADAGNLPLKDTSISGINSSAIFHEIYTYGVHDREGNKRENRDAVITAISECARVLVPGGKLAYRDVFTPEDNENVESTYRSEAMTAFIRWWLPTFIALRNTDEDLTTDAFSQTEQGGAILIRARQRLHREIQRHFITFRDMIRRQVFPRLGIDLFEETWDSEAAGIKVHAFKNTRNLSGKTMNIAPGDHRLTSPEYDKLTDEIIIKNWDMIIQDVGHTWINREGGERYGAFSLNQFRAMVEESTEGSLSLVPGSAKVIPRNYYNRYLLEVCDKPEFDGKQVAIFIKR